MWATLKNTVRRCIPRKVREFIAYTPGDEFAVKSYAQEGEDILLKRIFEHSPPGFYVDVGAHHPFRFSNTKLLYDMGWRGINIEPNPDVRELFHEYRPKDTHIVCGVGKETSQLTYYRYQHPALNTFDTNLMTQREKKPVSTQVITIKPLSKILNEHLTKESEIHLLTIDVEGMDLEVLKSNDWQMFKPHWICVETSLISVEDMLLSEIHFYLKEQNFELTAKLNRSCIYKRVTT